MTEKQIYVLAYDIGTTGLKTCLFQIGKQVMLKASASANYALYVLEDGGAEQDPKEWWQAMCDTTKKVVDDAQLQPDQISGISFCSQMQGLVLVDKDGRPVRRAMSYMDQRAEKQLKEGMANGVQIAGANVVKLIKSLVITGAVASSVKDPVWKYKWVQENEPDNFKRVYKWLDVKESMICKMTGEFVMTPDSAFAVLLYDIRKGKRRISKKMCKMLGVNYEHLPRIIESTQQAGILSKDAAKELGLTEGIPVFGGGGDASLIGVGAGSVSVGDTHIYSGTSGWVSTVVGQSTVDANRKIAAIVGADQGKYNYFAELETAGKCLEWVKDHLALDEIGIYLKKENVTESYEPEYRSLYDYLSKVIQSVPAGSNGVMFTPWLHGNRCPFEDPYARGMFFNISLETGKSELIRAVIEGICYHLKWFIESEGKKVKVSDTIRFVGGGALSDVTCQILADITGRTIETVENPQNVGAVGAAILVGVGLGLIPNIESASTLIPCVKTFIPNPEHEELYGRQYKVYKQLYQSNKKSFYILNQ
jgi:xylulokinase